MRDGLHECAHPECSKQIPLDLLACRPHWHSLPRAVRDRVWAAWQAVCGGMEGALVKHEAARQACLDWWLSR